MTENDSNTAHSIDLPYEIETLRAAYRLLPEYGPQDHHLKNLIVEGFWLHARNLLEMFLGKRNAISPTGLVGKAYAPKWREKLQIWYGLICNQISHLQDGRPVEQTAKLNSRDPDFVNLIEAEIANFLAGVPPEAQAYFKDLPPPMVADLKVAGPPNATNSLGFTGTGPGWPGS
jgi:hypothetical protein